MCDKKEIFPIPGSSSRYLWESFHSTRHICTAHRPSPTSSTEPGAQSQAATWLSAGYGSLCHNHPSRAAASLPLLLYCHHWHMPLPEFLKAPRRSEGLCRQKRTYTIENAISPKTNWAPSPRPAPRCICSTFLSIISFCFPWFMTPSVGLWQANLHLLTQEKSLGLCRCCQTHCTSDLDLPTWDKGRDWSSRKKLKRKERGKIRYEASALGSTAHSCLLMVTFFFFLCDNFYP